MLRRSLVVLTLALAGGGLTGAARAQAWPDKPIRLLVGYPPGGPVDTIARLITPALGKELGQPVIIENKPGAAGSLAINATVQAEPDGYTFGVGVLGVLAIAQHVSKQPFKPEDVNYVTMLTQSPHVLVTNPAHGMKDLKTFIEAARKAPGKLNYGSPGQGSSTHLDGELLQQEARIEMLHVPYKGGAAAVNALLGDEIQLLAAEISAAMPLQSKLKIAAVMGSKRSPMLPDVPTTTELGYPGVVASSMYGIIAPTKTPAAITDRFRDAVHKVLAMPEIRDRLQSQGQTPLPTSAEAYRKLMADESVKWAAVLKTRKINFD